MHGGTNRLNIMNESAASFGKSPRAAKKFWMCAPLETPSIPTVTSFSVAVACSFAISAETDAAAPCHEPKPRGSNIHAIQLPRSCRIDFSISSSASRFSDQSKCMMNQRNTHAGNITRPALSM